MFYIQPHLANLLLLIAICNLIEVFNHNPFNNNFCPNWYTPTGAAMLLFLIIEVIARLSYWGFVCIFD